MIFKNTGEVVDGFYVTGLEHIPVYLLDGQKPVLFDAGLTFLGEIYKQAILSILGNRQPEILFLTHVHFDHCGSTSYLKHAFPGLKVAASQKAADIIKRPNAIQTIISLNKNAREAIPGTNSLHFMDEPFEPFDVDWVLKDNQTIPLEDGLTVQVITAPGHTWDFLSYYMPERKILIGSEAAGCAHSSGYISTECLADFDAYMDSLKRLASLEAEVLCQGHRFVYTGEDVGKFFNRSIKTALEFKSMVEEFWKVEAGDMEMVKKRIRAIEYDDLPLPRQPETAYMINLEARIKSVLRGRE